MSSDASEPVLTFRCSTVFISEGGSTHVFRSIDDVPVPVKARIFDRARRGGSATIFIANRGGREQLARRLRGLPSSVRTRLEGGMEPSTPKPAPVTKARRAPKSSAPAFRMMEAGADLRSVLRHAVVVSAGAGLLAALLWYWR